MPFKGSVKVGFVVGDSSNIERGAPEVRFDLSENVTVGGSFSQTLAVYDNIGYWFRAYVGYEREPGDTVFYYGKARHYGYEMVDLGLSVKWANMNLGADSPEDYGYYYAWGELEEKDEYTWSTYKYGSTQNLGDNFNISGTENDVAHVLMGVVGAGFLLLAGDVAGVGDGLPEVAQCLGGQEGRLVLVEGEVGNVVDAGLHERAEEGVGELHGGRVGAGIGMDKHVQDVHGGLLVRG